MKFKYDEVFFYNRWRMRRWSRPSDWVIIGISTRWFSPDEYCYRLSLFGFEMSVWFKRVKHKTPQQ